MTPITNMATQGMPGAFTAAPRYGFRPAVPARPPAAGCVTRAGYPAGRSRSAASRLIASSRVSSRLQNVKRTK